jgi:hypothetical protein
MGKQAMVQETQETMCEINFVVSSITMLKYEMEDILNFRISN